MIMFLNAKNSVRNALSLFKFLEGKWKFTRNIPNFGYVRGYACFNRITTHEYFYREEGILIDLQGRETRIYRDYIYKYENEKISVFFNDHNKNLFHTLNFDNNYEIATAHHRCLDDTYRTRYEFINETHFDLTHFIEGPKKSVNIFSNFQKAVPYKLSPSILGTTTSWGWTFV